MGSIWPNISGSPERKHIWHGNSQEEILGKFEYMYLVRLSSFSKIVVLFTDGNFWKLKLFFFFVLVEWKVPLDSGLARGTIKKQK